MRDIGRDLVAVESDFLTTAIFKPSNASQVTLPSVVLRSRTRWRELKPAGGNVIRQGIRFVWPSYLTDRPKIGDVIVADGDYFACWRVDLKPELNCYETDAIRLFITPTSFNRCLLLVATYGKGEANEAKAEWTGYFSHADPPTSEDTIRCHLQPLSEDAAVQFGAEWSQERYTCFFENPIPREFAGGEFRLVDTSGNRYRAVKYYAEGRIEMLACALVERITEGSEFWAAGTPEALL